MKPLSAENWNILRTGKPSDFATIIGIVLLFLLIIATNVKLIFDLTADQTEEIGQMQLESIRSDLERTIVAAEGTTLRLSLEADQMLAAGKSRGEIAEFFTKQKKAQYAASNGVCINAYIAGRDWVFIPDFDVPADFHAPERIWYKGAAETPGRVYITEPYLDLASGNMCFTMSTLLADGETVVGLDFNFSNLQASISKMTAGSDRTAMIAAKSGMIIGYTDMSLVGERVSKKLPEYEDILRQAVKNPASGSFIAELSGRPHTIFSSATENGWYMILSVDNRALYQSSYRQMAVTVLISLLMLVAIIIFYLNSLKNRLQSEQAMRVKEDFLSRLSGDLRDPLHKILQLANEGVMAADEESAKKAAQVRESAQELSRMMDNLFSFSAIVAKERSGKSKHGQKLSKVSRHARTGITVALIVAMAVSLTVCVSTTLSWGDTKIKREVDLYDHQLDRWIARHRSILGMFANMIAERPELMEDYPAAVKWLNDMARNYPEISVCYMTNPYKEHTVIMNNGWQPSDDWQVEKRQWYIDTERSEDGFNISAPYYDEQTGLYCVTLSQIVYGKNGEFLGLFGIDFYLDQLIHVLGESYGYDGYAFLVDAGGTIINHPNDSYQMSVNRVTNIADTEYRPSYPGGDVVTLRDYAGTYMACLAKKSETSDFTIIVANRWWNIYGNIVMLGGILLLSLILCLVAVRTLIGRLLKWQQSVNLELREAAEKALAAGRAKSKFLAQMSHEIRTPLNAILGLNEMVMREEKDGAIRQYALNISRAGATLLSIINDILDFSKIESGRMEILPVPYELRELLVNVANIAGSRAEKKGLSFRMEADPLLPNALLGDNVRLQQVLINLLSNAVKYTEKGWVELKVSCESLVDNTLFLRFVVKDTGIGIREEDRERLFNDFERFDLERNRGIEGTGLGLAITYRLIGLMGGRISMESVYGEGTAFTAILAQEIRDRAPIGDVLVPTSAELSPSERYAPGFVAPEAKILVVDDTEMNLLVVTGLLKETRVGIDTCPSGEECLEKLSASSYDLVLLDHMMPGLDGIETLHLAKKMPECADLPFIILTANAVAGAKEMFLREGFVDYLSKPVDGGRLEEMLKRYLPPKKVLEVPRDSADADGTAEEVRGSGRREDSPPAAEDAPPLMDVAKGMKYCGGIAEVYWAAVELFCKLHREKQEKMEKALADENWKEYTTLLHALKSTSLSLGGQKLSDLAKAQEMAGKRILSPEAGEEEKAAAAAEIRERHTEAMELYGAFAAEAAKKLEERQKEET